MYELWQVTETDGCMTKVRLIHSLNDMQAAINLSWQIADTAVWNDKYGFWVSGTPNLG